MTEEEWDKVLIDNILNIEFSIEDIEDETPEDGKTIIEPKELLQNSFNGNQHISILNYN